MSVYIFQNTKHKYSFEKIKRKHKKDIYPRKDIYVRKKTQKEMRTVCHGNTVTAYKSLSPLNRIEINVKPMIKKKKEDAVKSDLEIIST